MLTIFNNIQDKRIYVSLQCEELWKKNLNRMSSLIVFIVSACFEHNLHRWQISWTICHCHEPSDLIYMLLLPIQFHSSWQHRKEMCRNAFVSAINEHRIMRCAKSQITHLEICQYKSVGLRLFFFRLQYSALQLTEAKARINNISESSPYLKQNTILRHY
jgi:hypothetical protein